MSEPIERLPGPRGHFLLGSIPAIRRDRVQFLVDLQRDYGDVVRIRLGPAHAVVIFHPDAIQRVMQENHRNYSKATRTFASVSLIAGNGLIVSDGDFWLRQRRLMQPAFHRRTIDELAGMIVEQADDTLKRLEASAAQGRAVNIVYHMINLALGVATQSLFSRRVQDVDGVLQETLNVLMRDTAFRFEHPFYPPIWFPAPRNRKFNAALQRLDGLIYDIIANRRKAPRAHDDLLALMIEARLEGEANSEEEPQSMTDRQLRDEVVTLFLAGYESTAVSLSWTLYLLSRHPDVEARVRREVESVLNGRPPTLDDLPRLEYLRMVRDESMRLFPPAWLTERKAVGDDVLNGYRIPAGTTLGITPFVTHRHPDFWEHPDEFDPERFSAERSKNRHPYAFFPFGGGPRLCIGKNLALLETHLALAMLLQRFQFRLQPGWQVEREPELTLRLKGGLWMHLTPA